MPSLPSGLGSQIMYGIESTVGTRVVPTKGLPFLGAPMKHNQERIKSEGIRPGRQLDFYQAIGKEWAAGSISHEFAPQGSGHLLVAAWGSVNTTGSGPYTHTLAFGTELPGRTIQGNVIDEAGTDHPFDWVGCQTTDLEISFELSKFARITNTWYGAYEDTAQSLAVYSHPANWAPYTYRTAVLMLGGSEYSIPAGTFKLSNSAITGRHFAVASNPQRPKPSKLGSDLRQASLDVTSDLWSLVAYNRSKSNTDAAVVLTFTQGTNVFTLSGNVYTDPDTPTVDGRGMPKQRLPLFFYSGTSDSAALSAVLVNGEASIAA